MSLKILAILCLCLPSVAWADWQYKAGYGANGQALGFGSGGQTLVFECGNGGYPAMSMIGPRPIGGATAEYVLRVDAGGEAVISADCGADGCAFIFETGGQVRGLINELRAGNQLSVAFYRNGLGGEIPLRGASVAIDAVMERGCQMP